MKIQKAIRQDAKPSKRRVTTRVSAVCRFISSLVRVSNSLFIVADPCEQLSPPALPFAPIAYPSRLIYRTYATNLKGTLHLDLEAICSSV